MVCSYTLWTISCNMVHIIYFANFTIMLRMTSCASNSSALLSISFNFKAVFSSMIGILSVTVSAIVVRMILLTTLCFTLHLFFLIGIFRFDRTVVLNFFCLSHWTVILKMINILSLAHSTIVLLMLQIATLYFAVRGLTLTI
jgi:hypothetical protein